MSPSSEEIEVRESLGHIANAIMTSALPSESSLEATTTTATNPSKMNPEQPPHSIAAAQYVEPTFENEKGPESMKLVVRSPYWGRVLKGKTRRNYDHGVATTYRVIACQVVLSATEGQYWGCCPHHGKRVLEMKEHHFNDHFEGNWDVYMIGVSVAPNYVVHAFFMLPQQQTVIDLEHKTRTQGWSYVGTASASVVRLDLEGMFSEILKQNDSIGFRYHHVHLEILMDQVFDRETPRSRKAAIEKARTDRDPSSFNHDDAIANAATISSAGSPAPDGRLSTPSPPIPNAIPNVISNDASCFSDATHSSMGFHDASSWSLESGGIPPSHYHHHVAYHHPMAWAGPDGVQWYPASIPNQSNHPHPPNSHHSHHSQVVPPFHPHMNSAQQMLHHGYVVASNPALPSNLPHGFLTGGAMDPHFLPSGAHSLGDHHHRVEHNLSHNFYPLDAPHMRMPEEAGYDDEDVGEGLSADDEKYNEEVATASVSETTIEEDISTTQQ